MNDLIRLVEMLAEAFNIADLRLLFYGHDLPSDHLNWNQPLMLVCRDAVRVTLERQKLGLFLRVAVAERPYCTEFAQFVAQLPPEAELRQFANRMNFDPYRRPATVAKPIPLKQMRQLVDMLTTCFSVSELHNFYGLGRLPSHFVNWNQALFYVCRDAVRAAVERNCLDHFLKEAIDELPRRNDLAQLVAELPIETNWLHYPDLYWSQLECVPPSVRPPGLREFANPINIDPAPRLAVVAKPIPQTQMRQLVDILATCFSVNELHDFYALRRLPSPFVNWNQALFYVCRDAVRAAMERNCLNHFLEEAIDELPHRHDLARLAAELPTDTNWQHYPGHYWSQLEFVTPSTRRTSQPLRPDTMQRITNMLTHCFGTEELAILYENNQLPHQFVNWHLPLASVCLSAVQVASDRRVLDRFLQAAVQVRPNRADLARLTAEIAGEIAA